MIRRITFLLATTLMVISSCVACTAGNISLIRSTEQLNSPRNVIPRTSFIQVKQRVTIKQCDKFGNMKICMIRAVRGTASGAIVGRDEKGTNILTAAHVCKIIQPGIEIVKQTIHVRDINQKKYPAEIVALDTHNDICILRTPKVIPFPVVLPAKRIPLRGDRVYNVAAPMGIAGANMVPIFEGFYIGVVTDSRTKALQDYYSLYAVGGSSGSMILNHRGRLMGMVTQVHVGMPISLGPKWSILKKFVLLHKNRKTPLTSKP